MPNGATEPEWSEGARRVFAFAKALGLDLDHLVSLLESYDLCLLSPGSVPPWMEPFGQVFDQRRWVPGGRIYHDVYRVRPSGLVPAGDCPSPVDSGDQATTDPIGPV